MTNSGSWIVEYSLNGKRFSLGIGGARKVSVAQAKNLAKKVMGQVVNGINPVEEKRKAREDVKRALEEAERERLKAMTFREYYPKALETIKTIKRWKTKKLPAVWCQILEDYACPYIGDKPLQEITTKDIVEVLKPIWYTKTPTADKLRSILCQTFTNAIRENLYTGLNPASWTDNLVFLLPAPSKIRKIEHFPSISHQELKKQIGKFFPLENPAEKMTLFAILTASRGCEVEGMKWEEIDFEKKIWSCPPERRKDGKPYPHRVPLTDTMIEILNCLSKDSPYLFPSWQATYIRRTTLTRTLRKVLGIKEISMHGMRSTFRDWAAETGIPEILAEKSLMHSTGNQVQQAYQRSDLLEQRREVMEKWDRYLFGDLKRSTQRE